LTRSTDNRSVETRLQKLINFAAYKKLEIAEHNMVDHKLLRNEHIVQIRTYIF
jgi:C4-dicarboxylate-specific signal transduction histidine kinase